MSAFALVDGWIEIVGPDSARVRVQPDGLEVLNISSWGSDGVLALLSAPPTGANRIQNLVFVDGDGEVRWRAKLPSNVAVDSYVAVTLDGSAQLLASTWSGHQVILDGDTGEIVDSRFSK
jgi:outer membrane protein assembly factor BamB